MLVGNLLSKHGRPIMCGINTLLYQLTGSISGSAGLG